MLEYLICHSFIIWICMMIQKLSLLILNIRPSDISRKKSKISRDFQGQIRGKSTDFAAFLQEKSQNSRKSRPILGDFRGRKVKIRRKIGPFRGIFAEKSQFSKDFRGQILRKIGRFHGKFNPKTKIIPKASNKTQRNHWKINPQISKL